MKLNSSLPKTQYTASEIAASAKSAWARAIEEHEKPQVPAGYMLVAEIAREINRGVVPTQRFCAKLAAEGKAEKVLLIGAWGRALAYKLKTQ